MPLLVGRCHILAVFGPAAPLVAGNRPGGAGPVRCHPIVLRSVAVPTRRRDRTPATVTLVALMLGATIAGTATVAATVGAQPRVTAGSAAAGSAQPPAAVQAPHTAESVTVESTTAPPPAPASSVPPSSAPATQPQPTRTVAPLATAAISQAERVVELVNVERRKAGCPALRVDQRLVKAAQAHSSDMAANSYFSHTSLDGRTFADRIRAAGYPSPAAENIAMGQRSAEEVMQAWMRSRGHRVNILNCGFVAIGVGLDTRGWYWTQDFGR